MPKNPVDKIETSCLGCCFELVSNNTQIGCGLGLLSKYDKFDSRIDEHGNEFYVIDGRVCNFKRPEEWAKGLSFEQQRQKALSELSIQVELIIYTNCFNETNIDKTIKSGIHQDLSISAINIINNSGDILLSDTIADFISKYNKPWKVQNILEEDATVNRCFDIAVKDTKFPYYLICESGYQIPNILHKINHKINSDLEKVSVVGLGSQDIPDALVGQSVLYKILQGNAGDYTFWQKLQQIEKHDNTNVVKREWNL